jgi:serine/threonine protein kinase
LRDDLPTRRDRPGPQATEAISPAASPDSAGDRTVAVTNLGQGVWAKNSALDAELAPDLPDYEVISELGRGGMGVVFKARQKSLNRVVALKMVLAGQADAEALARFRAEAEAIARIDHPNIIRVFEVGEYQGRPYFSLEYCPQGSLDSKLVGKSTLPGREAAGLVEQAARAIHAAHEAGVVHRDLKPANVLLGRDGVPKVTDFGIAKRTDGGDSATQTGVIMGTPSYMSPEQAAGRTREVGPLTDVYSLGRSCTSASPAAPRSPPRPRSRRFCRSPARTRFRRGCSTARSTPTSSGLFCAASRSRRPSATPAPPSWPTTSPATVAASRSGRGRST